MKQVLKSTPANRLQSVTEQYEIGDILFLIGAGIVTLIAIDQTRSLEREASAQVPWVIIAVISISWGLIVLNKLVGDRLGDLTGQSDGPLDFDTESDDEGDAGIEGMYDVDLIGVSKELAIIAAYILILTNIGFFSTSVVFIIGYIMLKEPSPLARRAVIAVSWTGFIIAILYVLFMHLLQVSSIFRLGVLF